MSIKVNCSPKVVTLPLNRYDLGVEVFNKFNKIEFQGLVNGNTSMDQLCIIQSGDLLHTGHYVTLVHAEACRSIQKVQDLFANPKYKEALQEYSRFHSYGNLNILRTQQYFTALFRDTH